MADLDADLIQSSCPRW